MDIQSASLSDRGRRKNNEDFAAYFEPTDPLELQKSGCLYIIADGVGGAAKGERASQFAAQKILYEYYQPENLDMEPLERLRVILEGINHEINDYANQNNIRMATTIVIAVVRKDTLYAANIGDSRVYLIRDEIAKPINRDHSIVGEMVERGDMTETEAMASKIKNRLTRSLGGDPEVSVSLYGPKTLQAGDKLLLCSDGLTRYATQEDIVQMTAPGSPAEIVRRLIKFANDSGGTDNVSVILAQYQVKENVAPLVTMPRPIPIDQLETLIANSNDETKEDTYRLPVRVLAFTSLIAAITIIIIGAFAIFIWPMMGGNATSASPTSPRPTSQTQVTPSAPAPASTSTTTTFTPTVTPETPTEIFICIAKIAPEGNLSQTLELFGVEYDQAMKYYSCDGFDEKNINCHRKEIENKEKVPPDMWIIVNIDESACGQKNGKWIKESLPK